MLSCVTKPNSLYFLEPMPFIKYCSVLNSEQLLVVEVTVNAEKVLNKFHVPH